MDVDFEAIYREYGPVVYRYLLALGCPAQDAEDITQDTFVKALLHIGGYRSDCRLSAWLCQIAKNSWYTALKRQRREAELARPRENPPEETGWLALLEALQEPYRGVFRRRALEGWSHGEIARHYHKSESWSRVTYHRARLQLQKLAKEDGL